MFGSALIAEFDNFWPIEADRVKSPSRSLIDLFAQLPSDGCQLTD